MALPLYLAMTGAEIYQNSSFPPRLAYMSCHFSPSSDGLQNLPQSLPAGSLLIADDSLPLQGHDPQKIASQLAAAAETLSCCGILLDFQRPGNSEAAALTQFCTEALPCPVAVSSVYADGLSCPVFLPPVPPDVSLSAYLSAWAGRAVWLDIAPSIHSIHLTAEGTKRTPWGDPFPGGREDRQLHCHYQIQLTSGCARFTLRRTGEDLCRLLDEAETLGVRMAVGLWQELAELNELERYFSDRPL